MTKKRKGINISSTAYRVLFILFLLNQGICTLEELIEYLSNDKLISRTFSKEVIVKYINTLKFSGFDISKNYSKEGVSYHLEKAPFFMEFTEEELKTLALIQNHMNYIYQSQLVSNFNNLLEKIFRYMPDSKIEQLYKYRKDTEDKVEDNFNQLASLIKTLEQYCIEKQTISISYSPFEGLRQKITLEPERIEYNNQKVYIYGLNPKIQQYQHLQLDYILDLVQLPQKSKVLNNDHSVTFKLKALSSIKFKLIVSHIYLISH